MDNVSKHRWLWWLIATGAALCLLLCCGGFGYVAYRSAHVYVETYEPTTSKTLNGGEVNVHVSVHHRIKSDWGDSLVGPPYWFRFHVPDATGKAASEFDELGRPLY